jgi:hypothetical protein
MLGHAVAAEPSRHHHKRRPGEQQPRPPPAYIATAYLITGTKVLAYCCKCTRKVRGKCEKSARKVPSKDVLKIQLKAVLDRGGQPEAAFAKAFPCSMESDILVPKVRCFSTRGWETEAAFCRHGFTGSQHPPAPARIRVGIVGAACRRRHRRPQHVAPKLTTQPHTCQCQRALGQFSDIYRELCSTQYVPPPKLATQPHICRYTYWELSVYASIHTATGGPQRVAQAKCVKQLSLDEREGCVSEA